MAASGHGVAEDRLGRQVAEGRQKSAALRLSLAALAAGLVLSGCGFGGNTIDGVLVATTDYHDNEARTCTGTRAKQGDQVRILSGSGEVLGTGSLSEGELVSMIECRLYFTVENVGRADFYTVEVGGRSGPTWSRAEMAELDWSVGLRG